MAKKGKNQKPKLFSGIGNGLKRANMSYYVMEMLVLFVHMVYAFVFYTYEYETFGLYNVVAALFYAWGLILVEKRRYRTVVCMTHIELMIYSCVSVLCFGWGYGFAVALIVLASMMYFNPFAKERVMFIFSILEGILFLALWVYTIVSKPWMSTAEEVQHIFCYVNYCSAFLGIIAGSGMSQISLHSLTTASNRIVYNQTTKAFSREYFHQSLKELLGRNTEKKYTLIAVRVIDFPLYRELFGQEQSEYVLRKIAMYLNRYENDFLMVGHISSDIFGVVQEKDKFSEEKLGKILSELEEQFSNERYRMHIGAGIYDIDDPTETTSIHCERARMALNVTREDYTKPCVRFDSVLLERSKMASNIVSEFEKALEKGEFKMHLQTQAGSDGSLYGAETLVRWHHPKKGMISPAFFIPVLESAGLICRLDLYIWEEAAKKLRQWKTEGKGQYSLSINISVRDFYHMDLYKHFTELVQKYDIEPQRLKLEITESVFMRDPEDKLPIIHQLQEAGFIVEIDDFGSGFSSLNMLREIRADVIKIDMMFLKNTTRGDDGRKIIESVINMAKTLNITTVVEGVETEEQFQDLVRMGADVFQGTYFTGALTSDEFELKYFGEKKYE